MIDLTRRKIVQAIAVALATPLIPACGGGGDGSGPGSGVGDTNALLIYPNALDPRIIGGTLDSGEQFVLYGEKDSNGLIMSATEMNFIASDLETSTMKFIPTENRFVGLTNGIQIDLGKDTNGSLNFGLVADDKQLAINLPPNLVTSAAVAKILAKSAQSRLGHPSVLTITDSPCSCLPATKSGADYRALAAAVEVAPIASVSISGCVGQNPTVKVIMRDETGKVLDVLFGKPDPSGKYNVVIPYLNTGDQALADAAQSALDFMSEVGISESTFSSILSALKDETIGSISEEVVQYLESRGKAAEVYDEFAQYLNLTADDVDIIQKRAKFLTFVGKSLGVAFKTYDVFDKLLKAYQAGQVLSNFIDAYSQQQFNQIQLQPIVVTSKGEKFSGTSSGLTPPEGPYPELSVTAPGTVSISGLTLDPSNPSQGQGYVATGEVFCLSDGDVVSLSILGTDGYSDGKSETVVGAETKGFLLSVPGAGTGVSDRVTLQVTRNGNVVATRSASLVFG